MLLSSSFGSVRYFGNKGLSGQQEKILRPEVQRTERRKHEAFGKRRKHEALRMLLSSSFGSVVSPVKQITVPSRKMRSSRGMWGCLVFETGKDADLSNGTLVIQRDNFECRVPLK